MRVGQDGGIERSGMQAKSRLTDLKIFSESKGVQRLFASSDCRFAPKLELRTVTALFSTIAMENYSE
jgi:hypothetical protein